MGGHKFRRQHPFDDFILDFVCLKKRLVIEIAGGQHAERQASDKLRTNRLVNAGFRLLRFWNHEVLGQLEAVMEKIWLGVERKGGTPTPRLFSPLGRGE